jgi:iron uptake system component EfeO
VSLVACRSAAATGAGLIALAAVAGCSNSPPGSSGSAGVNVKASDTGCEVAETTFGSGTQTFSISNVGSQVTEFYVYAPGDRVVGEVENIGPSTGKKLTVALKAGEYQLACKPGMVGAGIRTPIVVKAPSGSAPTTSPQLDAAVVLYRSYVVAQARLLRARSKPFVAAVEAGDIVTAKSLYAAARVPYESIEPIAASFGDLDPRIDARIDDVEVGQQWTGFHRLEHDLWKTGDILADGSVAEQLQADITKLVDQVQRVDLSADEIANGAKTLLTEVATVKIAGEEERYSRLDLVDASADVQGAQQAYNALRPIVIVLDPDLVAKIDTRFATLEQDLAQYARGASFVRYDSLSKAEVHSLSSEVDALISPMSQLAATVLKA